MTMSSSFFLGGWCGGGCCVKWLHALHHCVVGMLLMNEHFLKYQVAAKKASKQVKPLVKSSRVVVEIVHKKVKLKIK